MLNKTSGTGTYEGVLTLWGKELCFTWLGTLLCSVVPAVLFGSGVFSIGVLVVAVLVGIPFAVFGCVRAKGLAKRGMRRLAVMLAVPSLTLGYVFQVDEQIPENATPLYQAIESFRRETGHYPESLESLIQKHLAELPHVRFSVFQPQITYRIADGKPYLAIPSARGDMFAQFEYDFETEDWTHLF